MASPEVVAAVDRWARSVFGAPRRLSSLVVRSERKDEVIHRICTEVVRRDLVPERSPAPEQRATPPPLDPSFIDPFIHTPESLRAATLCVATCVGCRGAGRAACPRCSGSGRARCGQCGGAGSYINPNTNRRNKCKVCKATGSVTCGACTDGVVPCSTCLGSGHERAWLSILETFDTRVVVTPESETTLAHPQLLAKRSLQPPEVAAFSSRTNVSSAGPLPLDALDPSAQAMIRNEWARLDTRLERVVRQQYLQLAVPRQDVTYRMCGATGKLVLSGLTLTGAPTREAKHPIRKRLVLWPLSVLLLMFLTLPVARSTFAGHSGYFQPALGAAALIDILSLLASVLLLGGLLRTWGAPTGLRGVRMTERVAASVWVLALLTNLVLGAVTRPTLAEFDEELAAARLDRARVVLTALREVKRDADELVAAEDRLLLAEANTNTGAARLGKLDEIAAHGRALAAEAATAARNDRLVAITTLVQERRADDVIAAIDQNFADWHADPALAELRALAYDIRVDGCTDDTCRLAAAKEANAARTTPARGARIDEVRGRIIATLNARPATDATPAAYVQALTGLSATASHTLSQTTGEPELSALATSARTWADEEREKVAFLRADAATLAVLFPDLHRSHDGVASATFEDAEVYFRLGADGTCTGIYAVGPVVKRRGIPSATGDHLLSRTLGRPTVVPPQTKPDAPTSTAKVGGVKVVARWRDDQLVELRIGDAEP